ncbi:MAG: sporulation initiation factor Spo0A C-terminal domain-containing protein [Lachnospiraceae bacterium]|nr:sporulation initiation factor Spo0A C-terminal domain-containing protein [Lachnospiraceae bacterium]
MRDDFLFTKIDTYAKISLSDTEKTENPAKSYQNTRCRKGNFTMDILSMEEVQLESYVTRIMLDVGVPAHLKGYHYLRDAIMMSSRDMEAVSSVTKLLYPTIAKHFRTTDQKVERAVRNAIEVSWQRGNSATFEELFGYSNAHGRPRPTNSEYIARIADKVRLDVKAL